MAGRSSQLGPTAPNRAKPWYERRRGRRFQHDSALVQARCSGLTWRIDEAQALARLEGQVTIVEAGGLVTSIDSRIEFPRDYPASEPAAFETGLRFPWVADRHFVSDGRCCLWLPPQSKWQPDHADALAVFLDELVTFFYRQLLFDATGKWPGGWHHGVFGYWQYVIEELGSQNEAHQLLTGLGRDRNDPCPCGGGRRYKRCHWHTHDAIRRRIPTAVISQMLNMGPAALDAGPQPRST
jgi:hypothetical protein